MAIILDARLALDERHGEVTELTEYIGDRADEREVLCGLTCGAILRLPNHIPKYMDSASPAKAMKNGART